ncbi:putative iron-only hydrogenase system regulator [Desulfomonile tiedjei DSM 6799]|uniref:Putative iron-only hydrogenase system regulator n=2 Tax=Desulfomonile tiedjei TaxID=2358 RepID=I4CDX1_DESTA|nr:TM1266 family iron-only hydrogenase system putative regulator [Desulfomonile tiedjei]AFM27762.1 putative iron-only hydrogenase system regulator [Desulfomonile tiedjei DSM 6799]
MKLEGERMDQRLGVIGIIIEDRKESAARVNALLSQFGDLIVGRMGVPHKERGISVIGLIVEASTDQLGALTGKLGMLPKVRVKSILV